MIALFFVELLKEISAAGKNDPLPRSKIGLEDEPPKSRFRIE